jgi:hypothetical protein
VDESIDEQSQKDRFTRTAGFIDAIRKAAKPQNINLFINVPRDFDLASLALEGDRFAEGIKRSEKYAEPGDSGLFVPFQEKRNRDHGDRAGMTGDKK